MVKVNELRVGNIVDYFSDNADHWYNGKALSENDLLCLLLDKGDHADPIPLTEEWLTKFGWIWNEECKSFEKYPNGDARMHMSFRQLSSSYTMFNYVLSATIAERIYYVHQLQNLYFALTGEELTIKE